MCSVIVPKKISDSNLDGIGIWIGIGIGIGIGILILFKKLLSRNENCKISDKKNKTFSKKKFKNEFYEISYEKNENLEDKIIEILYNKNNLKSKYISKYLYEIYDINVSKKDLNRGILKDLKKKNKIFYNEKYEYYVK